jgi:DNA-directed RNA polymerase specialized sigma24 family protein
MSETVPGGGISSRGDAHELMEKSKQEPPEGEQAPATAEELRAAIAAMTCAELDRVAFYARGKAAALAALGLGISGDDLLQEAMERTVKGRRPWRKRVSLARHLIGVVSSIAGHAAKKHAGLVFVSSEPPEAGERGLHLRAPGPDPDQEGAAARLRHIRRRFADDPDVLVLIDDLREGFTGPETKQRHGFSETRYNTTMKRMRRTVRSMGKEVVDDD